ncbi:hypothetical protein V5N11_022229 [Cardamine amara subsp. amara]|uniref:DUF287 domain-containing protein n=1 Tax=Cardamine amara subsp. amara TaxID=228776 RepID=A0ABD1BVU9_CARAN
MDDTCGGDRLQIVNELKAVETFPWGRITFEDNLKEIDHAMNHFDGRVQDDYLFPGFIIPLEVLAFICIPELSKRFQEDISGAKDGCPLMCKKKFKDNGMPGFPLGDLNDALGKTDDIISILEPSSPEEALLLDIMERDEDEDSIDHIADAWNERLDVQKKKICWEKLYKLDVAARGFGEINIPSVEGMGEPQHANVPVAKHIPEPQLPEHWMIKKMKSMEDEIKELKMRLAIVERNQDPNSALRESEYQKEAETVATRDKGKDGEEEVTGEKTDNYVRTGEEMDADMRTGGDTMVDDKRTGGETMVGHETADDMRTGGELVDDDTVAGYEMAGDDEMRADGHMVGDYDMVGDGTVAGDKTVGVEMVGDEKAVDDKTCARKKGQVAPKRKPKPSIHITEPYTVEKNKQKKLKKQRKDDNMKEKK